MPMSPTNAPAVAEGPKVVLPSSRNDRQLLSRRICPRPGLDGRKHHARRASAPRRIPATFPPAQLPIIPNPSWQGQRGATSSRLWTRGHSPNSSAGNAACGARIFLRRQNDRHSLHTRRGHRLREELPERLVLEVGERQYGIGSSRNVDRATAGIFSPLENYGTVAAKTGDESDLAADDIRADYRQRVRRQDRYGSEARRTC
jgi:hypothetical protein